MTDSALVMSGELGDIFWDLPPVVAYAAGLDLGCSIFVANPTDTEKEYALMARLTRGETVISEEALPVFGLTWFKVDPGDFVTLKGALRFTESNADLTVSLIERETEQATDSIATRLLTVSTSQLPPWPGGTATGTDWGALLAMMLPVIMLGMMVVALKPGAEKKKTLVRSKKPGKRGSCCPREGKPMPGEFYQEGKAQKLSLQALEALVRQLQADLAAVKTQTDKLAGETPASNAVTADWQTSEADLVSIGADGAKYKLHSLLLGIGSLAGNTVTVRMYTKVDGIEQKVYQQSFNPALEPSGVWVANGTVGIHDVLRVTLQSNDVADNGKAVTYDYMLEAM